MMNKYLILIAVSLLLTAGCSSEIQENTSSSTPPASNPTDKNNFVMDSDIKVTNTPPTIQTKTYEELQKEQLKKQKRQGEMKIYPIENVGVTGDLEKAVFELIKYTKEKDTSNRSKLIYDLNFDILQEMEPFILAITKIELDNSRAKDVTDEYDLLEIASDVAIVKITTKSLDKYLDEDLSTGDYIFVKVDDQWKFYRFQ